MRAQSKERRGMHGRVKVALGRPGEAASTSGDQEEPRKQFGKRGSQGLGDQEKGEGWQISPAGACLMCRGFSLQLSTKTRKKDERNERPVPLFGRDASPLYGGRTKRRGSLNWVGRALGFETGEKRSGPLLLASS